MSWTDPLSGLGPISDHPSRASSISPALSSDLSDPESFIDIHNKANEILQQYRPIDAKDSTATILAIFLQKLPKGGQIALSSDIIALDQDHEKLRALRNHLVDAILKPMKVAGGQIPRIPISAPTDSQATVQIEHSMSQIDPSSRDGQSALKKKCVRRDGFRCVYSGTYDLTSVRSKKITAPAGSRLGVTECAHILPFALRRFDEGSAVDTRNKATIWWALHRYFPALKGKIDASTINQPENAITLVASVHDVFGLYNVAFWPTEKANRYTIRKFQDFVVRDLPVPSIAGRQTIDLVSNDLQVPLPNKEYFQVHCRVAEILEVSGLGSKIERELDMAEMDPENMNPDGSTDVGSIISRRMLMDI